MVFANAEGDSLGLRQLETADAVDLTRLLRATRFSHLHVDWYSLSDWLEAGCVFGLDDGRRLLAFLAIGADPLPAAWIRGAAIAESLDPLPALRHLLDAALPACRQRGATECAIMSVRQWPNALLPALGFHPVTEVMTMTCELAGPPPASPRNVELRPAELRDLDALAAIEEAAFEPIWRYSARGLARAMAQTFSFDVAARNGQIAGYQCSTASYQGAHLARMTVHPRWQRQGIGTALLLHALHGYRHGALQHLSLNTQVDNQASQRLYRRHGFQPTGDVLPVWSLSLT